MWGTPKIPYRKIFKLYYPSLPNGATAKKILLDSSKSPFLIGWWVSSSSWKMILLMNGISLVLDLFILFVLSWNYYCGGTINSNHS